MHAYITRERERERDINMGRPPCDNVGVRKGPWSPEEDIMLVSYIQDHGPGNWRAVPTNTGLMRCSKSCRLRWTNYLRPGIKRGNFTQHEEQLIVHLQALLGNRWAAIASYLPERTDNDIKNYWNTHLNKKLRKLQNGQVGGTAAADAAGMSTYSVSKSQWERRLQTDFHTSNKRSIHSWALKSCRSTAAAARSTISYASSAENISRLLEGWATTNKSSPAGSPASAATAAASNSGSTQQPTNYNAGGSADSASSNELKEPLDAGANKYPGAAAVAHLGSCSSPFDLEASKRSMILPGETSEQSAPACAAEAQVTVTALFESWLFDEAMEQLAGEAAVLVDTALEDDPSVMFQID